MANTYTQKTITWGNGRNSLFAGTPLDTNGNIANNADAVGILAEDLHMPDRTASVLTAGDWDEAAHRDSGIILSYACKQKLSSITFANAPETVVDRTTLSGVLTSTLASYVPTSRIATVEEAGIIFQAEAVADAEGEAPTQAEYNGLLGALREAGVIETPAEEPAEQDDPATE